MFAAARQARGRHRHRGPRQGAADPARRSPRWPRAATAHRGRPRRRQDHAGARARPRRSAAPSAASSSRAICCRRTSSASASSTRRRGRFEFRRGPIFANVVLADEINRTTPRTQSSLLEAMSEGRVSIDTHTHELEQPFIVIATQNPLEHFGTYPLPESQMDRFLLRLRMGYPSPADERARGAPRRSSTIPSSSIEPVVDHAEVGAIQAACARVRVEEALRRLRAAAWWPTRASRRSCALGVSPRGFQGWYRAAKARALVGGRDFAVPDDFKETAIPALAHRLVLAGGSAGEPLGRAREEAERVIERAARARPRPGVSAHGRAVAATGIAPPAASTSRSRASASRWRRWLRPPRRLSFTREGKYFVGITIGVGFAAINTGNNLLYLLLGMMLSLIIASGDHRARCRCATLTVTRQPPGAHPRAPPVPHGHRPAQRQAAPALVLHRGRGSRRRQAARQEVLLPQAPRRPPATHLLSPHLPAPRPLHLLRLPPVDEVPLRALPQVAPRRAADRGDRLPAAARSSATPRRRARASPASRRKAARAGSGEFHGLREFREGDDPRDIHWRSTAQGGPHAGARARGRGRAPRHRSSSTTRCPTASCAPTSCAKDGLERAISLAALARRRLPRARLRRPRASRAATSCRRGCRARRSWCASCARSRSCPRRRPRRPSPPSPTAPPSRSWSCARAARAPRSRGCSRP